MSYEPADEDNHRQNVDEVIFEECGYTGGDLQQTDIVMNDKSASHFVKMELPDYIDIYHEPELNQTNENISITDQSSECLIRYKEMDNENDIICQDSESEQLEIANGGQCNIASGQVKQYHIHPNALECNVCGIIFTSVATLRRHKKSRHTETRVKYTCEQCSKSFKTKWSLSIHTSKFHRNKYIKVIKDEIVVDINEIKTESTD